MTRNAKTIALALALGLCLLLTGCYVAPDDVNNGGSPTDHILRRTMEIQWAAGQPRGHPNALYGNHQRSPYEKTSFAPQARTITDSP